MLKVPMSNLYIAIVYPFLGVKSRKSILFFTLDGLQFLYSGAPDIGIHSIHVRDVLEYFLKPKSNYWRLTTSEALLALTPQYNKAFPNRGILWGWWKNCRRCGWKEGWIVAKVISNVSRFWIMTSHLCDIVSGSAILLFQATQRDVKKSAVLTQSDTESIRIFHSGTSYKYNTKNVLI